MSLIDHIDAEPLELPPASMFRAAVRDAQLAYLSALGPGEGIMGADHIADGLEALLTGALALLYPIADTPEDCARIVGAMMLAIAQAHCETPDTASQPVLQ